MFVLLYSRVAVYCFKVLLYLKEAGEAASKISFNSVFLIFVKLPLRPEGKATSFYWHDWCLPARVKTSLTVEVRPISRSGQWALLLSTYYLWQSVLGKEYRVWMCQDVNTV